MEIIRSKGWYYYKVYKNGKKKESLKMIMINLN